MAESIVFPMDFILQESLINMRQCFHLHELYKNVHAEGDHHRSSYHVQVCNHLNL